MLLYSCLPVVQRYHDRHHGDDSVSCNITALEGVACYPRVPRDILREEYCTVHYSTAACSVYVPILK